MRKLAALALCAASACSDSTTNPASQLNLDRPVDIAFACYGGLRVTNGGAASASDPLTVDAQPLSSCDIRSEERSSTTEPEHRPPGQEDIDTGGGTTSRVGSASWYAFILQSAPGTVAIARFDTKPSKSFAGSDVVVLDTDPLTPGKNGISVGEDPIAIATDEVGCYEVIANQGSCDMSRLNVKTAIDSISGDAKPLVERFDIKNAAGEVIRARPAAMAFQPAGGTIGVSCGPAPVGLAYIAFPSCHLVAGVDVATGTIVTGVKFDPATGLPSVLPDGNVTCPAECDGEAITPGVRPISLDLEQDPRTGSAILAIGLENQLPSISGAVLKAYQLDLQTYFPVSPITIPPLEDKTGKLALTSIAISPTIGMGGDLGSKTGIQDDTGSEHQFIYAVATDGSVRVVDISGSPGECDTQVDPRYLRFETDIDKLSCMKVGAATTPPRRAGVRGPGIELIGDAIPTSVDVMRVDKTSGDTRTGPLPSLTVGYFGLITAANGQTFMFNIDDDDMPDHPGTDAKGGIATPVPLTEPHQLRDAVTERGLLAEEGDPAHFVCNNPGPDPDATGTAAGGPRITGSMTRIVPANTIAAEKTGGLPSVRQVFCDAPGTDDDRPVNELFFSAPLDVREAEFPDLRALRADETWTMTYEGSLSNDLSTVAIDGPAVRMSQMFVDGAGLHLVDQTKPYCDAGVEPYDIVQLRGCDPSVGDAGCPVGYTCYVHPQSQVTGIGACMLVDEAERLSNACAPFLKSQRRYTVGVDPKSGELQLLPRKTVLRTTPLNGCDSDAQCQQLANYAASNPSSLLPNDPNNPTDTKTWKCEVDPDRKPLPAGSTGKRCLLTCTDDTQCASGTVCQAGYCMEGVIPPQACVNAPQRYELRAAEAFAVIGNRQGYIHPIIQDASGRCVKDPNASRLQIGRLPLDPLPCDPTADPRTGKKPDGTYEPNPCKYTTQETEYQLNYLPGTCTLGSPDESIVTRDATGLRFRNRALNVTIVDPAYPGDLMCHGDRMGALQNIPITPPGFSISFRITAGFSPYTVPTIAPAFPIKVTKGPTNSMWIIDEGDFLSTSISQASTRGKVYRVESRAIGVSNVLE